MNNRAPTGSTGVEFIQHQHPAHAASKTDDREELGALLGAWAKANARKVNPRTTAARKQIIDRYIMPSIGDVPLSDFGPEHVAEMRRYILVAGASAMTVRQAETILAQWSNAGEEDAK
jgi:hypothetical protein